MSPQTFEPSLVWFCVDFCVAYALAWQLSWWLKTHRRSYMSHRQTTSEQRWLCGRLSETVPCCIVQSYTHSHGSVDLCFCVFLTAISLFLVTGHILYFYICLFCIFRGRLWVKCLRISYHFVETNGASRDLSS